MNIPTPIEVLIFLGKAALVTLGIIIMLVVFYFKGKLESYSEWYNEHEVDK